MWISCFLFPKEIKSQQLLAQISAVQKDMIILEKSEFTMIRNETEVCMEIRSNETEVCMEIRSNETEVCMEICSNE
ncbi:hypothetical protein DPMN_190058 [Dreissena polymorpha]|uniref:Uncharacterized protein n=1 Tax=Dreissena polymorpha TaxID=45954 RepID=A0A9D4IBD9_DREPO|nr:hypothetical protein DPMN_190058 [Dreissena polymorpha]